MIFIRQPRFILRADQRAIPVITGPEGHLLTNEYIRDVQDPNNVVFACMSEDEPANVELVRFGNLSRNAVIHDRVEFAYGLYTIPVAKLNLQLKNAFIGMLRSIGLEHEVPKMLPAEWLKLS